MSISVKGLLTAAFAAVILGVFFGGAYDVVRIFRTLCGVSYGGGSGRFGKLYEKGIIDLFSRFRLKKAELPIVIVTDLLYMVFVTVSFIVFLFSFNYGIFRWFILFAAVLGFLIYYFTVGRIVIMFSRDISDVLRLFFDLMLTLAVLPLKYIFRLLSLIFSKTVGRLFANVKNTVDIRKKNRYTNKCIKEVCKITQFDQGVI